MADDKKKYNYMEDTLKDINAKFISLPDGDIKRNNQILQSILTTFIEKMKEKNALFKAMFFRVFYGGSYYDGLRVGKPEEFDLDLLMRLPKYAEPVLTPANIPGFVHLQLKNYDAFMKQPEATPAYRNFHKLLDEKHFLDTSKVLNWMEGVVQQAMNDLPQGSSNGKRILSNSHGRFEIIVCKGGPALTLKLEGSGVKIDVDFVACFEFAKDKWPVSPFKPNPVASKPYFFIVPKKPKTAQSQPARYWRLSFQEQERVLIDNKRTLKPTIKLLKKMRDTLQHKCIASYYIKTVLLHIAEKKGEDFWKCTQSYVFMAVLKEYREFIERGKIPYYWNTNNNLIGAVDKKTLENINNRLKVIINDIEKNSNDPKIIAKYLLNSHEYNIFMMSKLKM